MGLALSLLDKSPRDAAETFEAALARTVRFAKEAERLGFVRFWTAEHHNTPQLAGSAPEVLISHLLAHTSRIRIGSGGVMLQHYSPYKVAEVFNLLATLAPGRVDLGVGKAPGGLPLSTRVLQYARDPERLVDFEEQLTALDGFLRDGGPEILSGALDELAATPIPGVAAGRFLLGASPESAALAVKVGWSFVFARHINNDDASLAGAAKFYRKATGRPPLVAVAAIVDADGAEARAQADGIVLHRVEVEGGQSVTVGTREQAEDYVAQGGYTSYRIIERKPGILAGTADEVLAELEKLSATHAVEEFIVDLFNAGDARLEAARLLAEANAVPARLAATA